MNRASSYIFRKTRAVPISLVVSLVVVSLVGAEDDGWLRPKAADDALIWGRRDGLIFGLPSPGGLRGPRGLIRVGVLGKDGQPELINFIAIEPVVKGVGTRQSRMAFSELEMSKLDPRRRGKRLWTEQWAGELTTLPARPEPIQQLSVRIEVERFTANGAHVFVTARMSSDRPQELQLAVRHHDDSVPIEELTVTATMGNYERLRQLWLRDRLVDSRELYAEYTGDGFIDRENYPRDEMLTYGDGDALVLATTNEEEPASVKVPAKPWWTYTSIKLTQYWRVPAWHIQPDLRVKVNGRRVYWNSTDPIPGGPSFENFEVRQRYVPDQMFIFGLTPTSPRDFVPAISGLAPRTQER
ncbi:MAG: hypothetical protein GEU99_23155 [Luteitalea sp.]|nr:hypothetical protein [Luteitalea sp.]